MGQLFDYGGDLSSERDGDGMGADELTAIPVELCELVSRRKRARPKNPRDARGLLGGWDFSCRDIHVRNQLGQGDWSGTPRL